MTHPTTAHLEQEYQGLLFDVRRLVRYHMRRRRFYEGRNRLTSAMSVILGSTVMVTLLGTFPKTWLIIISPLVAVMAIIDLVAATTTMARLHSDLARKFNELEQQLVLMKEPTEDELKVAKAARLKIEADQPPTYRVLDILCHNEMILAWGYHENELYIVPLYKRMIAHLVPFGDASIRKKE